MIEVPVIQIIDGIKYVFQDWSDGVQNNIRKIDLEADLSLVAQFLAEPIADFANNPQNHLVGEAITFDASTSFVVVGSIQSYFWNFGDGTSLTTSNPITTHIYDSPNTYEVELLILDNKGVTSPSTSEIVSVRMPTHLSISTECPSTLVGFQVEINGSLLNVNVKGITGETIVLSYTFQRLNNWISITSDQTDTMGQYSITWIPPATGYFTLKVDWKGNSTYLATSNSTSICSISMDEKHVFSVESNSTISQLSFNSTDRTFSFNTEGVSGSPGYVKVTIPRTLVKALSDMRVYLDDRPVEYSLFSNDNYLNLIINYMHSIHKISVDLDVNVIPEFSIFSLFTFLVTITSTAMILRKKLQAKILDVHDGVT